MLYRSEGATTSSLPTWAASCRGLPPGACEVRLWVNDDHDYSGVVAGLDWGTTPVHIERSPANVGFAGGVNGLARGARGGWLCLLNPDIEVEAGTFAALGAWVEARGDGDRVLGAIPMRTAGLAHAGIAAGALLYFRDRPLDGRGPLGGPSGGAALVPMAAWRDGGGLWERFFAWGEDVDLALRLWHAGWRTEVVPVAPLHHAGGHSVADRQGQRRKAGLLARNRVLLWARLADWRLAVPLVPVWACGALAICALHLPERTAGATVAGFAEGVRGWRDARRSLPAGERLGPADWLRLRRAG